MAHAVAERVKVSRRTALSVLERYTGDYPTRHRWRFTVHDRGVRVESDLAPVVMATVHPSSILRSENREEETALLVEDLRRVAEALRSA